MNEDETCIIKRTPTTSKFHFLSEQTCGNVLAKHIILSWILSEHEYTFWNISFIELPVPMTLN